MINRTIAGMEWEFCTLNGGDHVCWSGRPSHDSGLVCVTLSRMVCDCCDEPSATAHNFTILYHDKSKHAEIGKAVIAFMEELAGDTPFFVSISDNEKKFSEVQDWCREMGFKAKHSRQRELDKTTTIIFGR